MGEAIQIGISNKHVHLTAESVKILFNKTEDELIRKKDLVQKGQYACEETVDVVGPKGTLKNVRLLAPLRPEDQVELAQTDARGIGIKTEVRMSGDLAGTAGCKLIGPCGEVELDHGVIIAMRHIHLGPKDAEKEGVKDGDVVSIKIGEDRGGIFEHVAIRVKEAFVPECHIDTDEANAFGCNPNSVCYIVK